VRNGGAEERADPGRSLGRRCRARDRACQGDWTLKRDYATPRPPLSERLPIVTYTNLVSEVSETVWMSPQVERITGYRLDEWVGNRGFLESVLHEHDRGTVLEEMRASRGERRAFCLDYRLVGPDGGIVWIHDESVPILDPSGRPELIQGYFTDITRRKELERQLLHAQRTEELGRLAGQIAHDFNNVLMATHGYADELARRLPRHSEEYECARHIIETSRRARYLTRQLLAFGCRQQLDPREITLPDVLRALQSMLERVAGDDVEVSFELAPSPPIHADFGQLEQTLVNLVANARDAMPYGGVISVEAHTTTLPAGDRAARLGLRPGQYAVLSVSDTGHGIDAETKARIFEPFFTTKGGESGSGLGLAIVESVIRQYRGAIELETSPGQGATFRIYLPAVRG